MLPPSSAGDESTLPVAAPPVPLPPVSCAPYLLIFDQLSSLLHPLPASGTVTIGRGAEADVRLASQAISRAHAHLTVTPEDCLLADLRSENGTFLNGERIAAPRSLLSGDVLLIGGVTLVFQRPPAPAPARIRSAGRMRQRICAELDRSRRYQRRFAVLALSCPDAGQPAVAAALEPQLRPMDFAAWDEEGRVLLLLPEVDAEEAGPAAERLLDALGRAGVQARAGLACYPQDGEDVDALLAGARAGAAAAAVGQSMPVRSVHKRLQVGDLNLIVADPVMHQSFELLRRCAAAQVPLLLRGEVGVGKATAARLLHAWSARGGGPFVSIPCGSLQAGADAELQQRLQDAQQGTILFSDVDELPPALQARLIWLLEGAPSRPDVRLIAATRIDLRQAAQQGRFRRDLYDALRSAEVNLPPLRERPRELPLLAEAMLDDASARLAQPPLRIAPDTLAHLRAQDWPGNLRQLRSTMEFVASAATGPLVRPWHLPDAPRENTAPEERPPAVAAALPPARPEPGVGTSLDEEIEAYTRRRIHEALALSKGKIAPAARLLGRSERWLRGVVGQMRAEDDKGAAG